MVIGRVTRRSYPSVFKDEAVALAERGDKSVARIAADLGIADNLLHRWLRQKRNSAEAGIKAFLGHGRARDEELARLRKEVRDLRETNEILKKAARIFAKAEPR